MDIRERRKALRLKQQEVADFLEVDRTTIVRWENNPGAMPLGKFLKLDEKFKELEEMHYGMDAN